MSALRDRAAALFADPNPILVKELRATFRTPLFVRFLYLATAVVALFVLAMGAAIASDEVPPAMVGRAIFQLFLGAGLLVICLVAPGYASAAITSEREQETWESLALSGMSAGRIVWGKLAACYASIALVLVALSPIVGVSFLFGGVSPGEVLVGLASLFLVLVPAVSFGLAISARLRSTRVAVVVSTLAFAPLAMAGVSLMGTLGADSRWTVRTPGPFFYTEVLATRLGELDAWVLLVALPLYALGMASWFLIASAVSGLRSPAEDRAGPMKRWALAMSASSVPVAAAVVAEAGTTDGAFLATSLLGVLLFVYGLLFTNEPALPPRAWVLRQAQLPRMGRALGAFGAGAAGTMRFSIALSFVTALAFLGAVLGVQRLVGRADYEEDLACVALGAGAFVVGAFTASLGARLRLALRSGAAARVAALSIVLAASVLPFLIALLIDVRAIRDLDRETPLLIMLSPVHPAIVGARMLEEHVYSVVELAVSVGLYGTLAAALAVMVEVAVRRARRDDAARRARVDEDGR